METIEIERSQWESYFDSFSRQHQGEVAVLREIGQEIGDQIQASDQPFVGISADMKDGENPSITVILGQEPNETIQHIVSAPERVYVFAAGTGATASAVQIEEHDGPKTLLELRPLIALT